MLQDEASASATNMRAWKNLCHAEQEFLSSGVGQIVAVARLEHGQLVKARAGQS
jgi:hypothetical protein